MNILTLILLTALQGRADSWECLNETWVNKPETQNGIFVGSLSIECRVMGKKGGLPDLRKHLENLVASRMKINGEPKTTRDAQTETTIYDVTVDVRDEGSPVRLEEDLELQTEHGKFLKYRTSTRRVEASGLASYLKSVEFETLVQPAGDDAAFDIKMTNTVRVKRPWYAVDFIFVAIAKKKAIEKMHKLRDEVIPDIAEHL